MLLFVNSQGHAIAQKTHPAAPDSNPHDAKHTFKTADGATIGFWLMTPATIEDGRKSLLVLSLHRRSGATAAAIALGKENNRMKYPCFVMAPRVDSRVGYWAVLNGIERPHAAYSPQSDGRPS